MLTQFTRITATPDLQADLEVVMDSAGVLIQNDTVEGHQRLVRTLQRRFLEGLETSETGASSRFGSPLQLMKLKIVVVATRLHPHARTFEFLPGTIPSRFIREKIQDADTYILEEVRNLAKKKHEKDRRVGHSPAAGAGKYAEYMHISCIPHAHNASPLL